MNVDLRSLVDKMSQVTRDALEGAAGICMARAQYNVEVEHWLVKLMEGIDNDMVALLEKHEVNLSKLSKELTDSIEKFKSGSSRPASLSPAIIDAAKNAWMLASIEQGLGQMTSGHLLAALLLNDTSRREIISSAPSLKDIAPESIRETAKAIVGTTGESAAAFSSTSTTTTAEGGPAKPTKTPWTG